MNEDILNAVVKLLEQGGSVAVWMWAAYLACGMVKFLIGCAVLFYAISRLYRVLIWGAENDAIQRQKKQS
jgi:hypothetical protein